MREHNYIWAVMGLILFLSGCAHRAPLPDPGQKADLLWEDQSNRARILSKVAGRLTLSYEGNKQSVSGHGQVLADLKGKLRIELRDPLGRVQYLALLSKNTLVAYYPGEKTAYADNHAGERYLKRFVNIELSFLDLEQLFLGILPAGAKNEINEWEWDPNEGVYLTSVKRADRRYGISVDGQTGAVRRLTIELPKQKIEVTYSGFKSSGGNVNVSASDSVSVAHVVEIRHQATQSSIEVDWKEVRPVDARAVEKEELFRFQAPEGVRKISLD